MTVEGADKL